MRDHVGNATGDVSLDSEGAEELYGIGDLAQQFDITTRTIRFYETKGLLTPRRVGGARAYCRRDRARLQLILRGKRLGFSLEDISEYLNLYDADPTQIAQLKHLVGKVEGAMAGLEQKRADIDHTLRELKGIRAKAASALSAKKKTKG